MARGQRKSIEQKITEKEEIIAALQVRVQSEQKELEALYDEKRQRELEAIEKMIKASGLSGDEVQEALRSYAGAGRESE